MNRERSQSNPVNLGFGDLSALPGNHVAHFYRTVDEWMGLLVAYHKAGIEAGDKCVYLMNPARRAAWETALAATGVDLERAFETGQLVVIEGLDEAADRVDGLASAMEDIGSTYPRLRSGGDVNWTETHWHWEAHICSVEGPEAVFLCQYDISTLGGDVVVDAMRTHPVCVIGGAVVESPLYTSPKRAEADPGAPVPAAP